MEISRQEVLDLLREWQRKKRFLQCTMIDSLGNNALVFGCIEKLDDHSVQIDARTVARQAVNLGMAIALDHAAFSFANWPEQPQYEGNYPARYESFLIATFPNGSKCQIYVTNL